MVHAGVKAKSFKGSTQTKFQSAIAELTGRPTRSVSVASVSDVKSGNLSKVRGPVWCDAANCICFLSEVDLMHKGDQLTMQAGADSGSVSCWGHIAHAWLHARAMRLRSARCVPH